MKTDIKKVLLQNKNQIVIIKIYNDPKIDYIDLCAKFLKDTCRAIAVDNIGINDKEFLEISKKIRQLCSFYEAIFFIVSRCDIATLSEADGIILKDKDISINDSRKFLSESTLVGAMNKSSITNEDLILSDDKLNTDIPVYIKNQGTKYYSTYKRG